jgi:UPF0042 nucleotide-binding protein
MNNSQPSTGAKTPDKKRVLIVSGLSGAGKTLALKTLEDLHYEAIDNVPLRLLSQLVKSEADSTSMPEAVGLAIGIDPRTRAFNVQQLLVELVSLSRADDIAIELLYLDCEDAVLLRRYQETRRRHPLSGDHPVQYGIDMERAMMLPLREIADHVIDTSNLTNPDLRQLLDKTFQVDVSDTLTITLQSFAYRRGLPQQADLVFDVRFLANPYYEPDLRSASGLDAKIAHFIEADDNFQPFMDHLSDLLTWLVPKYQTEGKSYLDIAFGCTGGQHRSVFVADTVSKILIEKGFAIRTMHRDINAG